MKQSKTSLLLLTTLLSTSTPILSNADAFSMDEVKSEKQAKAVTWVQKEETNLTFEQAKQLVNELKAKGFEATLTEEGTVVIVKPAKMTAQAVLNFAKDFEVPNENIYSFENPALKEYVEQGNYAGKDTHTVLHVLNNPEEEVVGDIFAHSTTKGEKLPSIDEKGYATVNGSVVKVTNVQNDRKELGEYSTKKDDKIPTIYDNSGKIVDVKDIVVGKTYYTDKQQSKEIVFTKNEVNTSTTEKINAQDLFYAPAGSFGNKQNYVAKNHTFKEDEVTLADAAPGSSAADPNASAGSIVSKQAIDLTKDFTLKARVHLGNKNQRDQGADGIGFTFNPVHNSDLGYAGQGFGIGGLSGAFGFKLDTYYNDAADVQALLNATGGKKYYDIDPMQYKNGNMMNGELGGAYGNGQGNAFGGFIQSVGKDGTVETITDGAYDSYDITYNKWGTTTTDHYTGEKGKAASDVSPKFISNPEEFKDHWKPIEFKYNSSNETLTVNYDGKHWSAPLSTLVPTEKREKMEDGYKLMISSSTGWGANLHQVAFDDIRYTVPVSESSLSWKMFENVTSWNTQKVKEVQKISVDEKRYKVSWKEPNFLGVPPIDVFPKVPPTPVTPTVPVVPPTPVTPEVPVVPPTPVTPEVPVVPPTPVTPEKPVVPTTPEKPKQPETPITPEVPETPETPKTPESPVTPEIKGEIEERKTTTPDTTLLPHTSGEKESSSPSTMLPHTGEELGIFPIFFGGVMTSLAVAVYVMNKKQN